MLSDPVLLNDWHVVAYAPDLQAELHLRSDRTAIAYREWLRQLGLSFGIA